ncbi:putative pentatricopeptide repeat-containing protein At5g37570 [Telopea speciosissima]|uniref:putative pentatricopeptide repeat-containing protein At5g37570 n=1 Tax=Telopea speciosissima TaxID=54955 RepID=UPI001CC6213A|nr:putative pentatricopeptide repeat-containing protein At5g37570 [Telopea speciosissima]
MQTRTRRHHENNKVDRAASLLKACISLPHLKQIHAYIFRSNLHQNNSLASTLVSLYAFFSFPRYTLLVFSSVSHPNLSLFNHSIRAFSKIPTLCIQSIHLYLQMIRNGIRPDNFTYPFLLNSCAALSALHHGTEIHGRLTSTGFGSYLPVCNALIDMYGKCNALDRSYGVFDEMPEKDVVSYNALLGAHARLGEDMRLAQRLFDHMPVSNVISWNAMIVGYVNSRDLDSARAVFDRMPERNVVSWTTMLVGYTKHGLVGSARALFDAMPQRNLISWTAMITGYAQNGQPSEALSLFHRMEEARVKPDAATMTGVISACAQLGGTELVQWVASYVDQQGIERNERVLTALVDMHAKCGNMEEACRLFEEIPQPDVFSYSALITGLASHGHGIKALEIFRRMQAADIEPDDITFVGVLTACSHTGLVEDGLRFWESMAKVYRIEPGADHYACIVDMLGRAGQLEEAHRLVKSMPMGPHPGALGALLAACRTYGNVQIAERVAQQLFELEPQNTGNYMLLASIYASKEQWEEATRVRVAMKERGMNKLPGCSWI